mmetsp:Transcript_109834/g.309712  ORF Transcript_109834/g.309712 Transcript_109834/m.309712 type:complete len:137 (-) Transcript_109834:106-516(-)
MRAVACSSADVRVGNCSCKLPPAKPRLRPAQASWEVPFLDLDGLHCAPAPITGNPQDAMMLEESRGDKVETTFVILAAQDDRVGDSYGAKPCFHQHAANCGPSLMLLEALACASDIELVSEQRRDRQAWLSSASLP